MKGVTGSPEVILGAVKVHEVGPGIDRPYSSFYSGRRSDLELESGPGLGIGLGMYVRATGPIIRCYGPPWLPCGPQGGFYVARASKGL